MLLRSSQPRRRGTVLLAVLVAVVLLALAAHQFSTFMLAESRAVDSHRRAAQARALAESGVHYTAALLATPDSIANNLGSNPWSNPGKFQGVEVIANSDNPKLRGLFSIISPVDADDQTDGQPYRYGVT